MINFIDSLIDKIENRSRCSDICIKKNDIYYQNIEGNVQATIKVMRENCFTHIPILDDGIVIGVFDENSVFNYIADNEIVMIDSELTFSDIKQYLSIDDREMESFVFMPYDSYVEELEDFIEMEFKKGKRIGMALLTSGGKKTSPLMNYNTVGHHSIGKVILKWHRKNIQKKKQESAKMHDSENTPKGLVLNQTTNTIKEFILK